MMKVKLMGCIGIVALTMVLISGCAIANNKHVVDQEVSESIDDTGHLKIEAIASELTLVVEDRQDVKATFEGSLYTTSRKEPQLTMESHGGDLDVYVDYPTRGISVGEDHSKIVVYIPEAFVGELEMHSVSGDVLVPDVVLDQVSIETVSGEIDCERLEGEDANLKTVSGDVVIRACLVDDVKAESVSGEIEVYISEDAIANLDTSSVSGDIKTDGGNGDNSFEIDLDLSTVSGDISVGRY